MNRFFLLCMLGFAGVAATVRAEMPESVEQALTGWVARPEVTVVHLWAPWCPNCRNEMKPEGWATFIAAHPDVHVVFVNIWHGGQDPAPKLSAGGLGSQPNFTALTHPNGSRKPGERMETLLGVPVGWVPSTWVYRAGKLRYALNYGEVRFDMLNQMVTDAQAKW